ncbi:MAG: hypothetical protein M3417_10285 [Actinomycetota bacterium]|nr:hypothetical protein [Actinomycetota bacterium]
MPSRRADLTNASASVVSAGGEVKSRPRSSTALAATLANAACVCERVQSADDKKCST